MKILLSISSLAIFLCYKIEVTIPSRDHITSVMGSSKGAPRYQYILCSAQTSKGELCSIFHFSFSSSVISLKRNRKELTVFSTRFLLQLCYRPTCLHGVHVIIVLPWKYSYGFRNVIMSCRVILVLRWPTSRGHPPTCKYCIQRSLFCAC